MGLVPWISRTPAKSNWKTESATVDSGASVAELPARKLINFEHRGSLTHYLGRPEATLLVVSEADSRISGNVPWSKDESQLFDLMMRAIELTPDQLQVCSVAGDQGMNAEHVSNYSVSDLCNARTRAIVFFDRHLENEDCQGDYHEFKSFGLPMWRILHPCNLLLEPIRKRMAWESLKAINAILKLS